MTSTTTSTSGSRTTAFASLVKTLAGSATSRSRERLRTATLPTCNRTPVRASIESPFSVIRRTSAEPTCPQPSRPTRTTSSAMHTPILSGPSLTQRPRRPRSVHGWSSRTRSSARLAPDHESSFAIPDEHHRRSGHLVVVAGHRVRRTPRSPGSRAGRRPPRDAGRWASVTITSPCSQCFPAIDATSGPGLADPVRQVRLVARAVEDGPRVVAHPAVDRDVRRARHGSP